MHNLTSTPRTTRRAWLAACTLIGMTLTMPVQAQLYDALPPANSSYVRVLAAPGVVYDVLAEGRERASKVPSGTPSPYMVLTPGSQQVEIRAGGQSITVTVNTQASRAFTVLVPEMKADKAVVLSDKSNSNRLKATIMAYNLSGAAADLTTADGQTAIFKNLAPSAGNGLVVNPVSLDYKATAADQSPLGTGHIDLTPGSAFTVVVMGAQNGGPSAVSHANSVERYKAN